MKFLAHGEKWDKTSGKARLKIPSSTQRKIVQFQELFNSLKLFLNTTTQGDWDKVCENPAEFLRVVESIQEADLLRSLNSDDLAIVREILALLDFATKQCTDRMEQIAPLVKALIPAKDTSDSA